MDLPLIVMHGARPGPCLWVSAAIHGDELNGVEIIRELLDEVDPKSMQGTLLAVPILNVFGFIHQSRYLPDRRDLNRSFPGSKNGSLAARLAHLFMTEVVSRCQYGIDLHTGSNQRENLPQIRTDSRVPMAEELALAFGAPLIMESPLRQGSLRAAAGKRGIPVLVYEAGEANRFDRGAITTGVRGVLRVMRRLDMWHGKSHRGKSAPSLRVESSSWVRARHAGLLRLSVEAGDRVEEDGLIGSIADPFGEEQFPVLAPFAGMVVGLARSPVVYRGDALVNLGRLVG